MGLWYLRCSLTSCRELVGCKSRRGEISRSPLSPDTQRRPAMVVVKSGGDTVPQKAGWERIGPMSSEPARRAGHTGGPQHDANDAAPKNIPRQAWLAETGSVGGDSVVARGSLVSQRPHNGRGAADPPTLTLSPTGGEGNGAEHPWRYFGTGLGLCRVDDANAKATPIEAAVTREQSVGLLNRVRPDQKVRHHTVP